MNRIDLIRMGLKNLFRRKLRTFLTTLGIIIGTISIVVMISIGLGMQISMDKQLSNMGNIDIVEIYPSNGNSNNGFRGGMSVSMSVYSGNSSTTKDEEKTNIKEEDLDTFKQIKGVENATPVIEYDVSLTCKKYENNCNVVGMNVDFMELYGLEIDKGRMLEKGDKYGYVYASELPYDFYNPNQRFSRWGQDEYDPITGERKPPKVNPLEDRVKLNFDRIYRYNDSDEKMGRPVNVTAVGAIKKDDYWRFYGNIYMDFEQLVELRDKYDKMTAYKAYDGRKPKDLGYKKVYLYVPKRDDVKNVQKEIEKLGFTTRSNIDQLDQIKSISNTISMVFGGIGGIALLVAAIGITNTMVMAIYERRKEIGVMKVIGASIKDIKKLFLFESATLGLLGGLLGIAISLALSYLLNNVPNEFLLRFTGASPSGDEQFKLSIIPPWLIILALVFTSFIGLVSGYLPARKAMKLSALEAIKTD